MEAPRDPSPAKAPAPASFVGEFRVAEPVFETQWWLVLALFEAIYQHAISNAELPHKMFAGKCNGKGAERQRLEALFSL